MGSVSEICQYAQVSGKVEQGNRNKGGVANGRGIIDERESG
jgi:hypothetical protein